LKDKEMIGGEGGGSRVHEGERQVRNGLIAQVDVVEKRQHKCFLTY
jgi:hypothetical protein